MESTSYNHKVRAIIHNSSGKLYITDMNGSYNLPGGGVLENEDIKDAIKREIDEEMGLNIKDEDFEYLGNYHFYHHKFPDNTDRENEVDLFYVSSRVDYDKDRAHLTEYEKSQSFKIREVTLDELKDLRSQENTNPYKKFTDLELDKLVSVYLEKRN